MKSEKTGRLRVLHRNLLLPVSTIEEDSMDTTLENSRDFYQIDPEGESAPDHGANYEETEITASAEPCSHSSEQETGLENSSLPEPEKIGSMMISRMMEVSHTLKLEQDRVGSLDPPNVIISI